MTERRRVAAALASVLFAVLLFPAAGVAQTNYTWTGGNGAWSAPGNWSPPGIPGPADSAMLGAVTVTLTADVSVGELTLNGTTVNGDGTKVLSVAKSGLLSGSSFVHVKLQMEPGCAFELAGGTKSFWGGTVTNAGTVTWTAGQLVLDNGVLFHNAKGALFDIQFDALLVQNTAGTSTFKNAGTYRKSAGAGTNTVQIISFINEGAVEVQSGALSYGSTTVAATVPGNVFQAAAGAMISFNQANTFSDTTFSGPGLKRMASGSGEATFNGEITAENLEFYAGTWRGTAVLNGGLEWTGGILRDRLTVREGASIRLSGVGSKGTTGSGVITNAGTILWTGGQLNLDGNGTIYNLPGALFDVQFDGWMVQNTAGTSTFRNAGTYRKSAGAGTNTVQIISFINEGAVEVQSGALSYGSTAVAATDPGNVFQAAAGAMISFNQANTFGDSTFSGPGLKRVASGSGEATFNGEINAENLEFYAGTWRGTAVLNGILDWTGGAMTDRLTVREGSRIRLSGVGSKSLTYSGVITNAGTILWTGGQLNLDGNGTIYNLPGALFDVQFDGWMVQNTAGTSTFRNEGIYRKSAGTGTNTIQIVDFVQAGSLEFLSGFIRVVGNYAPTAGSTHRTVFGGIVPGVDFGQLQVSGNSTLAGLLSLGLANGFVPTTNQAFQIFVGARTGFFSGTSGSATGGGLYLTPTYLAGGVRLDVVDGTSTLSKPGRVNGLFQMQIGGTVGGRYQVEASTNLTSWVPVSNITIPGSGVEAFIDADSAIIPYRFYRAAFVP